MIAAIVSIVGGWLVGWIVGNWSGWKRDEVGLVGIAVVGDYYDDGFYV